MVIDYDNVEVESSFLEQRTLNGVENGSFAVPDRDNDARLHRKLFRHGRQGLETRFEPGADTLEMFGRNSLHFDLIIAILRIDIIELLLTCGPRIQNRCGIERLRNPDNRMPFRNTEPQIV